jgi:REP element-mobilizing transposase RayT
MFLPIVFVHVWFSSKYRKGALESPDIAGIVVKTMRYVSEELAFHIEEIEPAVDHMHLLLRLDDIGFLPDFMHRLKGASSRRFI